MNKIKYAACAAAIVFLSMLIVHYLPEHYFWPAVGIAVVLAFVIFLLVEINNPDLVKKGEDGVNDTITKAKS